MEELGTVFLQPEGHHNLMVTLLEANQVEQFVCGINFHLCRARFMKAVFLFLEKDDTVDL